MLVIHGRYFLARRILAFRNDYCLACAAPRLALRHRTFDVLHVFWIPLLPLGFWKRWHCSSCGQDPHAQVRTSRAVKWIGVGLLAFFGVVGWLAPIKPGDEVVTWFMRIGLPLGALWAGWATARSVEPESLKERLAAVRPHDDPSCPLCGNGLVLLDATWRCTKCGVERAVAA